MEARREKSCLVVRLLVVSVERRGSTPQSANVERCVELIDEWLVLLILDLKLPSCVHLAACCPLLIAHVPPQIAPASSLTPDRVFSPLNALSRDRARGDVGES